MESKSTDSPFWSRRLRQAAAQLTAKFLTPFVHGWVLRQEAIIRRQGRPLDGSEIAFARLIGVAETDSVRILTIARIPLPAGWLLKGLARFSRVVLADPVALTAGFGIYLQADLKDDLVVIRHELVHVRQYERLGRKVFLKRYIWDCLVEGYAGAPLEKEARRLSTSIDGG